MNMEFYEFLETLGMGIFKKMLSWNFGEYWK